MNAALELTEICKSFGPTQAVDHASLSVAPGTVHAVLGENGAGKTTLMNIAYGLLQPERGTIRRDGKTLHLRSPADALAEGIGMVQQHYSVVPAMSVAENVALGERGRYDSALADRRVRELGRTVGLALDPSAIVRDLPVSAQQRLEILKAVGRGVEILILDEPTAVLAPAEAVDLMRWVRSFADQGHAVVLITHKLREAIAVADHLTVLRRGRVTLHCESQHIDERNVLDAMLGEGRTARAPARASSQSMVSPDQPELTVLGLRAVNAQDQGKRVQLRNANMSVRAGEFVGVVGVEGSGHTLLLRLLAGRHPAASGEVVRPGDVAFVPADRHLEAVALSMTLTDNHQLRGLSQRRGIVDWDGARSKVRTLLSDFGITASGPDALMSSLSGGNQQRFVLARELSPLPPAVVVENPTRGLDVAAAQDVIARLRMASDNGAAVLWYSSDVDELLPLVDRIFVVHDGELSEARRPFDRDTIGRVMLGAQLR